MNMLAIRYFCLILETEESISEIGSQKKLSYDFGAKLRALRAPLS